MRSFTSLAALLALCSAPAFAQAPPDAATPPEDQEIVVEGQRKSIEEGLKQLLAPTDEGQLARFETKICPRVFGLPADWTEILTRTIRGNIASVGATVAEPDCRPNAIVIFIYDPDKLMQGLKAKLPDLLGETPAAVDALAAAKGPVASWHLRDLVGRDGQVLQRSQAMEVGQSTMPADFHVVRNAGVSRLYTNIREDMRLGFVVIDAEKIPGTSLRQLADLATMHLLLDVKPEAGARDHSSILSLLEPRPEGASPPRGMSATDRAALSGFYALKKNNYTASQQRRRIAKEAAKQLKKGE